jgi:hypothetical protein
VNPEYVQWSDTKQQVFGFLLMSMTRDVMAQVSSCATPREIWNLLEQTHASRSKSRVINTRMALATTQKGNLSISEYLAKMKSFVDDMASTGKALEEEELVSYILMGLDFDYNLKNIYLMLFASSLLVMVFSPTGVTVGGTVPLVG